jgi:hypothetical protein
MFNNLGCSWLLNIIKRAGAGTGTITRNKASAFLQLSRVGQLPPRPDHPEKEMNGKATDALYNHNVN